MFTFDANAQCTGCFHPSFGPASSRAFGADFANSFVSGDFDRDGFPDLVFAYGYGIEIAGIGFMKGSGSGSFAAPVLYASQSSNSIVAADFNGDGLLDVATAGDLLSVFLGNGDGTFAPPIEITTNTYGSSYISAADFNGDGVPDLALNVFSLGHPQVFLGHGDGTFQTPSELPVIFGNFLTTGDFNADGRADVAVSGIEGIYVFLGDGHGGFAAPVISGPSAPSFVVGDFDGDGFPDLAVDFFDEVRIELGNGDGTFADGQVLPTSPGPDVLATGDFDLDGRLDLAVSVYQSQIFYVFHGLGNGGFGPGIATPWSGQLNAILLGDFDANGRLDVAGLLQNFVIETLMADSTGAFATALQYPTGGTSDVGHRLSLAIADLTGDGNADVAVTNLTTPNIGILPGDGAGHLGAPITVPTLGEPHWIATGAFDAGTDSDFAVASDAGIQVFLSNGDGTFQALPAFGPVSQYAVSGDFNGDGKADLAVGNTVTIWLGNGDGTFTAGPAVPGGVSGEFIEVADFNNDLKADLLVEAGSVINVLLGNGDGSFTQGASFFVEANAIARLAIGDFDGDGNQDFVGGRNPGDVMTFIYLYWGKGDGTFDVVTDSLHANYIGSEFRAADVNGDGLDDIVMSGAEIFTSNGDRTFERSTWIPPLLFGYVAVGDLNGDGKPDLAYEGGYPVQASVLLNTICAPVKLVMSVEPASCDTSGVTFDTQPVLHVVDGGDNLTTCVDGSVVIAAIRPGTGAPGAVLGGTATIVTLGGVAAFTDLSIDRPGRGYVLEFTHPTFGTTHGWTVTQDLTAVLSGPATICAMGGGTYEIGGGYDRYEWFLDGAPISRAASLTLSGLATGPHDLDVTAYEDGCIAADTATIEVLASPDPPSIIAPVSVRVGDTAILASATSGGNSYTWSLSGGTITGGQGTSQVTFDAGAAGTTMVLRVIEASGEGCVAPEVSTPIQVDFLDAGSGPFREDIDTVARHGITAGCGNGNFCPDASVTRAEMAVFLLKAEHGPYYLPPTPFGVRLRRRSSRILRRGLDHAAARGGDHGRLRLDPLLPGRSGDAGRDGRVPPEDRARVVVHPAAMLRHLQRRRLHPGPRLRRGLDRAALRRGRHHRLQPQPPALLSR